ncbi:MAG: hypothetical protein IT210_10695 [Armatimonadetes bacterium]|nr:hypothetical protein [Armatimonadota bacterium]
MARSLRCPKCNTLMMKGYMTFPICHKCHENLVKCRYCQHYDLRLMECTSVLRDNPSVPDADVVINCQFYSTARKFDAGAARTHRPAIALALAAVLILVGAALAWTVLMNWQSASQDVGGILSYQVAVPDQVEMSQGVNITVAVSAPPFRGSDNVVLRLEQASLENLRFAGSVPEPQRTESTRKNTYLHYGPLAPGQAMQVSLSFAPEKAQNYKLRMALYDNTSPCGGVQTVSTTVVP